MNGNVRNERRVLRIPLLTLGPGISHMRTRALRDHRLLPAVPAARAAPRQPNRPLTAVPAPLRAQVPRKRRGQECAPRPILGRGTPGAGQRVRRGREQEGGKRRNGAAGSKLRLFPSRGRPADGQGMAAILGFPDEPEPCRLSPAIAAPPRPAGLRFPD